MRILVIGGTRFMGPHVVRQLHQRGHELILFHRGQTDPALPPEVRRITGDRRRLQEYAEVLRHLEPDVILDMICMVESDAQAVIDLFSGRAGRLVVASSADVYRNFGGLIGTESGEPIPAPMNEEAPLRTRLYPYRGEQARGPDDPMQWRDDYDKIPIERLVLENAALPGTILRLPMVWGPGDGQRRLLPYLKRMDDGRPAILLGTQQSQWRTSRGYVENVAAAIALAVLDPRAQGRLYNVADEPVLTEAEWVRAIGVAAGWSGEIAILPDELLPTGADYRYHLALETSRIRNELGYREPVGLAEGLARTIAWDRQNPPGQMDPAAFDYAKEEALLAQWQRGSNS
jgi:nucleoside-diphosphate-sugar epimerase